jgi:hypothetical protein
MKISLDDAGQMQTQTRYDVSEVEIGENQAVYEEGKLSSIYCYDTAGNKIGEISAAVGRVLGIANSKNRNVFGNPTTDNAVIRQNDSRNNGRKDSDK